MGTTPVFVTETDESKWTDCTWASALMLANEATRGAYPPTRAEREALRIMSGDLEGGSNLDDVDRGTARRYKFVFRRAPKTWDAFMQTLKPQNGALLQGLYSKLPDHFTRWDPPFAASGLKSGHAVYIERLDNGQLWWMDPLGRGTYKGEVIPEAAAKAFAMGLLYVHASVAYEGEFAKGGDMLVVQTVKPFPNGPRTFRTKPGTQVCGYDATKPGQSLNCRTWDTSSPALADAEVWVAYPGTASPPIPKGGPFLQVVNGVYAGQLIVESLVTLDPEPDQPDVDQTAIFNEGVEAAAAKASEHASSVALAAKK